MNIEVAKTLVTILLEAMPLECHTCQFIEYNTFRVFYRTWRDLVTGGDFFQFRRIDDVTLNIQSDTGEVKSVRVDEGLYSSEIIMLDTVTTTFGIGKLKRLPSIPITMEHIHLMHLIELLMKDLVPGYTLPQSNYIGVKRRYAEVFNQLVIDLNNWFVAQK